MKPKLTHRNGKHQIYWPAFGFAPGEMSEYETIAQASAALRKPKGPSGGISTMIATTPNGNYEQIGRSGWPTECR